MKTRGVVAGLVGVIMFAAGIVALRELSSERRFALSRDSSHHTLGMTPCSGVLGDATLTRRVMSEKESQILKVELVNKSSRACSTTVQIVAQGFETDPAERTIAVRLNPGQEKRELVWSLSPIRTGSLEIGVMAGGATKTLGIRVTTILGLSPQLVDILGRIASILGPTLTIPWWIDRWERRKKSPGRKKSRGCPS